MGRVWSHIKVVVVVSWQFKAQTVAFTTGWPVCLGGPAGGTRRYVVMSQVTSVAGLSVLLLSTAERPAVENAVYPEVLL